MISRLRILLLIVAFALGLGPSSFGVTLEDLDTLLAQAHDSEEFLSHPDWVERYYEGLVAYYGADRMNRTSFNAILDQLRTVSALLPELKTRLWETLSSERDFSIPVEITSYGRLIDVDRWQEYIERELAELDRHAGALAKLGGAEKQQRIQETLAAVRTKLEEGERAIQASGAGKNRSEKMKGELLASVRADPGFREAVAALVKDAVSGALSKIDLTSGTRSMRSDLVLHVFERFRSHPELVLGSQSGAPEGTLVLIKKSIPSADDLLKHRHIFSPELVLSWGKWIERAVVPAGEYRVRAIPRRFHGLFEGIIQKVCIGGSITDLDSLIPSFWGLIAVEGAVIYHVERDGKYMGYSETVPIRKGPTGETFLSTVIYSPPLKGTVTLVGRSKPIEVPFYEIYLREAEKKFTADERGFVLSEEGGAQMGGALEDIKRSRIYKDGQRVGAPEEFELKDPFWEKLGTIARDVIKPTGKYGRHYVSTGRVAIEAFLPDTKTLTRLMTPPDYLALQTDGMGPCRSELLPVRH